MLRRRTGGNDLSDLGGVPVGDDAKRLALNITFQMEDIKSKYKVIDILYKKKNKFVKILIQVLNLQISFLKII